MRAYCGKSLGVGHLLLVAVLVGCSRCTTAQRSSPHNNRGRGGVNGGGVRGRTLGQSLNAAAASMTVVNTSPPDGTIAKAGQGIRLSCSTNQKWFFCVWRGPRGDKQCAIQESSPQSVCPNDNRILLEGGRQNCDIVIRNVQPQDYGDWTCFVSDSVDFDNDKGTISLEVGIPATVEFRPGYVAQNNVLEVTEEDEVEIRCAALGAHPIPQISWEAPTGATIDISRPSEITEDAVRHTADVYHVLTYRAAIRCAALGAHPIPQISWEAPTGATIDISRPSEITEDAVRHTADVYHVLTYRAALKDDKQKITCIATQLDRDGRTVMYESTTTVLLKVNKLVLPIDGALTQKIGIISGILLAIIFLILCIVFILFALCKKRRRRRKGPVGEGSRPTSSQATDDTSDNGGTGSIKPIWTTLDPLKPQHPQRIKDGRLLAGGGHANSDDSHDAYQNGHHHHGYHPPHHHHHRGGPHGNHNTTLSTHSSSQGSSWEEDRSVGGELEDSGATASAAASGRPRTSASSVTPHSLHSGGIRLASGGAQTGSIGATTADLNISAPSPSLHETHFDESDFDYPRTVLHHPDPYHRRVTHHQGQRPPGIVAGAAPGGPHNHPALVPPGGQRPSSSADVSVPYYTGLGAPGAGPGGRPTSAMDGRYSDTLRPSRIQTPSSADLLNTSVKSVFDCEQGCFVPSEEALLDETLDSNFTNDQSEYLLKTCKADNCNKKSATESDHPRDV